MDLASREIGLVRSHSLLPVERAQHVMQMDLLILPMLDRARDPQRCMPLRNARCRSPFQKRSKPDLARSQGFQTRPVLKSRLSSVSLWVQG